ncbi:isocitrate/isopropylmalate dehydrogenase family protein [Diaminobutyricimonas sp. LJ205]|uniref:isocitrate/isopropylmalate dehydrogenase family protein n=1 Tax=Diaminobutyricimonas sp. LJ205 TaxID=2683590 RepID=UPI0012F4A42F|nr:isocitrate/isopropylmalate family dehydrogenase [Diaminobutyricimonas sp. LJ205]
MTQSATTTIGVIEGDGIGPEIIAATIDVLQAVAPDLSYEFHPVGHLTEEGHAGDPLPDDKLEKLLGIGTILKGPLSAPKGTGRVVKVVDDKLQVWPSVNNGLRRAFDLYANDRPIPSFRIGDQPHRPEFTIVREVSEGIYSGIEHRIGDAGFALKTVTEGGWRRIAEHAFDLARTTGYNKVVLGHKANVLNVVDGMQLSITREVAAANPDVEFVDVMVDALGMYIVRGQIENSVVLLDNQYGDILSDVAAAAAGSLGLGPGANLGTKAAMFEACHGAAPDIAGQGIANPTGMVLSGALMLDYVGLAEEAGRVRQAVRTVLERGNTVTVDVGGSASTTQYTAELLEVLR